MATAATESTTPRTTASASQGHDLPTILQRSELEVERLHSHHAVRRLCRDRRAPRVGGRLLSPFQYGRQQRAEPRRLPPPAARPEQFWQDWRRQARSRRLWPKQLEAPRLGSQSAPVGEPEQTAPSARPWKWKAHGDSQCLAAQAADSLTAGAAAPLAARGWAPAAAPGRREAKAREKPQRSQTVKTVAAGSRRLE